MNRKAVYYIKTRRSLDASVEEIRAKRKNDPNVEYTRPYLAR
jgi:hypothetical protein